MRNVQGVAPLHSVDSFVFRAVVAKDALDIWNTTNQVEIAEEQS